MDYNVTMLNEQYPNNLFGKIMGELYSPLTLFITKEIVFNRFIRGNKYDLVLIIGGRGVSKSLIYKLKEVSPKIVGYNFDSFKYHSDPLKWFKQVTNYYTFDYQDSYKYSIPIVELFSSMSDCSFQKEKEYALSAIVRNHSNRLQYIDSILKILKEDHTFIFIYEKDVVTFIINFLKNPILYLKYWNQISFSSLPYSKYIDVLKKSNFTIDYTHPKQTGITIRCFEALSCQTKIITNNSFMVKNPHFNTSNTLIFKDINKSEIFIQMYNGMINHTPEKFTRSIKEFVNELIK
jgi:hypothetical protein